MIELLKLWQLEPGFSEDVTEFHNQGDTHCHQKAKLPADAPAALEPVALAMSHCKQDLEHG